MALGNINLDDRTYEQLLAVLKQHIPTQEWRDHNPSDPGIMLLELLAWLGEMSLYCMNRVPRSHREKFLKLIADPPQPVTSLATFTATLNPLVRPLEQPLRLPAGTRLATDFSNGRRFVFETLEELAFALPLEPPYEAVGEVTARERVIVDNQRIGTSDGTADQVFAFKPPRAVVETPDHPPQMSIATGFAPALVDGGKLGEGAGIARILFDEADLEEAHLLSYDAGALQLTLHRLDGPSESTDVGPEAFVDEEPVTVSFPALNVEVVLDLAFDTTVDIEVEDAVVTIIGGTGAISAASVPLLAARGLPQPQDLTLLTFSRLSTPATAVISTAGGLNGVVDLASPGTKTVYLDDAWGRGFQLEFNVTHYFNGTEESADIDLRALQNLFFLGTSEEVRHSPWSEVLMDFVYRTPEYDPNPQVRVSADITRAIAGGGDIAVGSGFVDVVYPDATMMEQAFLFRYLTGPPRLWLRRLGGPVEIVEIDAAPIPPGTTETVSFPGLNVEVVLNREFDKTAPVTIEPATVVVTGGSGVIIDPPPLVMVRIDATKGLLPPFASTSLSFSNLSNPEAVVISAGPGLRAVVDLSTTGPKIARLSDIWDRRLDVRFEVDTEFNGTEESVSFELHALENLFFLGTLWEARRSLRTRASRVGVNAPVHHCHVDPFDSTLRFGDGTFGSIPPSGAEIVASYRVLQGPEALVRKDELKFLLDWPPLIKTEREDGEPVEESLSVSNRDAEGGLRFFAPETRTAEALIDLNRTYRLVTAEDFERVLLTDFNEFDAMAQAAPNVLSPEEVRVRATANPTIQRAVAMMNRDAALEERRGHVAILVLPRAGVDLDERLQDRILRFLEERRLITTRLSLTSPQLKAVTVTTVVIIETERSLEEMTGRIETVLQDFFDIYTGYFEGGGWPLGRTVYRSEIYQVLEGIDGADHVKSLVLSPADANHDVALSPVELPILDLNLSLDRA